MADGTRPSRRAEKMPLPIEEYALIGDCHTAALVGRDGSIDWLCLPRLDSGACFAALLGGPEYGRWLLAPSSGVRKVHRAYRDETLVLDTEFETGSGAVRVIDCMSLSTEGLPYTRAKTRLTLARDSVKVPQTIGDTPSSRQRLPFEQRGSQ